ncbi:hypothetical protein [Absidia glauca]|uniref:Endonuclease/exonuclease/phosphatase domain-containing protein n=1 Tax=Absidia glauca TaxID=4829 RepID=A0A168S2I2_ABSGL|nr:hypothetical protein [Absidia glauca]
MLSKKYHIATPFKILRTYSICTFSPRQRYGVNIAASSRYILATISHAQDLFTPFTILNIYAPAQRQDRPSFYRDLVTLVLQHLSLSPTSHTSALPQHAPSRLIIVGDLHVQSWSALNSSESIHPWVAFLETHVVSNRLFLDR